MAKQLVFREDARRQLKTGIDTLARAVATTLGPKGRNVALDKKWGAPTVTHDDGSLSNWIYRAYRYGLNHPTLANRDLNPEAYRQLNASLGLM